MYVVVQTRNGKTSTKHFPFAKDRDWPEIIRGLREKGFIVVEAYADEVSRRWTCLRSLRRNSYRATTQCSQQ